MASRLSTKHKLPCTGLRSRPFDARLGWHLWRGSAGARQLGYRYGRPTLTHAWKCVNTSDTMRQYTHQLDGFDDTACSASGSEHMPAVRASASITTHFFGSNLMAFTHTSSLCTCTHTDFPRTHTASTYFSHTYHSFACNSTYFFHTYHSFACTLIRPPQCMLESYTSIRTIHIIGIPPPSLFLLVQTCTVFVVVAW